MAFGRKARRIKLLEEMLNYIHTFVEVELRPNTATGWEDFWTKPEHQAIALDLERRRG